MPKDGESASQKFEDEALQWELTGRMGKSGSGKAAFTVLRCWVGAPGAQIQGVSDRLKRYYAAASQRLARRLGQGWYDAFLRTRASCSICGTDFRLENLGMCTHCDALIGYCHQFIGGYAPNGNLKCPRCPNGETVG